jgi:hypothetical protein
MDATQPLRDVFAGLAGSGGAGEPATVLAASGHHDLPDGLMAEAVVNYADTAPVEVAEHLAPFVRAHSAVPGAAADAPSWLAAVGTAPADVDPMGLDAAAQPGGLEGTGGLDAVGATPDVTATATESASAGADEHYGRGDTAPAGPDPGEARWVADDGGTAGSGPLPEAASPHTTGTAESDLGYFGEAETGEGTDADPADLDDLG